MEFVKAFKAARRVSTPLIAVRTTDAASTIRILTEELTDVPVLYWDVMRGMMGANKPGITEASRVVGKKGSELAMATMKPTDTLEYAEKLAEGSVLFMNNMQEFWKEELNPQAGPIVRQAIWNLRDVNKAKAVTLVMLTTAGSFLPRTLQNDVLILDAPLPDAKELERIVNQIFSDAQLSKPKPEAMDKAVSALIGLSSFSAEQRAAMCLTKSGLDYDNLWEAKRQAIEQTRGLTIDRGGFRFSDIGGVENAKDFFNAILKGKDRPELVVFIDEIEKQFAGTGTDLSGVKTELTGKLLSWMQDNNATGSIFIGPPGATKTMLGKAIGNEGDIPTIALDFAGMQSSLVGSSGENLSTALKVIEAISRNRVLFIATCNSIGALPPELRRRFTLPTFFFDLPTVEEREVIWDIYLKKFKLEGMELPKDKGWTGAEIKNTCQNAYRLGWTLKQAAEFTVPVSVSAREVIQALREQASGNYISASQPGLYKFEELPEDSPVKRAARMIRIDPRVKVGEA